MHYIPSKQVENYLKEQGVVFSDFEKATLLWNNECGKRQEILDALLELAGQTTDEKLRMQIEERLRYEENMVAAFLENPDGNYIYVVMDDEGGPRGYYTKGHAAVAHAKRKIAEDKECYSIKKQPLIFEDEPPMITRVPGLNPYMLKDIELKEQTEMYDSWYSVVSSLYFDLDGELSYVWSKELEIDHYNPERFENRFFEIPYPFEMGEIVRHIRTGKYWVVETGKEDWKRFMERVKNGLYVDYSDMCIIVEFLTDSGVFSHSHINPIYLERAEPAPDGEDALLYKALKALSVYWSGGEENAEQEKEVLCACRKYAESRREKSEVETAKRLEDIII